MAEVQPETSTFYKFNSPSQNQTRSKSNNLHLEMIASQLKQDHRQLQGDSSSKVHILAQAMNRVSNRDGMDE